MSQENHRNNQGSLESVILAAFGVPFIVLGALVETPRYLRVLGSRVAASVYNPTIGHLTETKYTPAQIFPVEDSEFSSMGDSYLVKGYISKK